MSQPLHEFEARFIRTLKTATGKTFKAWLKVIAKSLLFERKAIRDWLQQAHQLDYLPAHKLSFLYLEDLELNGAKVYFDESRDGSFLEYSGKAGSFTMNLSYGGSVLLTFQVPDAAAWKAQTGLPLSQREFVLHYIGWQMVKNRTDGQGRFEIKDHCILIQSK